MRLFSVVLLSRGPNLGVSTIKKMNHLLKTSIKDSLEVTKLILESPDILKEIESIIQKIILTLKNKKKILFFGNGGSAADSQHMSGEFVSRFMKDRRSLAAIALTTDTSIITSISNDHGYQFIFSRQIEGIGEKGDIAFAYSTSGKSLNVINGLKKAKQLGICTVGFTGMNGGDLKKYCDLIVKIPSDSVPRIQEGHLLLGHIICQIVEEEITKDEY